MNKQAAYVKTIRVIQSCHDHTTLAVAEKYMHQYTKMYVHKQEELFHLAFLMNEKRNQLKN